MSATSAGATIAARQTASHKGRVGIKSAPATVPSTRDSGMPITSSRKVTSRRRTTANRSRVDA